MTTVNKLLDKARTVCKSDAEIARRVGVSRSAVSLWRKGGKIDAGHVATLLELTQQDPALVVQVMREQDAPPAERRMWSAVWDRLSPVTTVIGVCALAFGMSGKTPEIQHFASVKTQQMYIMSIVTRWLRRLRQRQLPPAWSAMHA